MGGGGSGCSGGGVGVWVAREGRGAVGGRGVAVLRAVCGWGEGGEGGGGGGAAMKHYS